MLLFAKARSFKVEFSEKVLQRRFVRAVRTQNSFNITAVTDRS